MSAINRVTRLVQFDLEAYFLFNDTLPVSAPQETKTETGLEFTVLDRANVDATTLGRVIELMQSAQVLTKIKPEAEHTLNARFQNQDACALAWDGRKAIGFAWIAGADSDLYRRFGNCARHFPAAAILNQAFVDPSYRGRKLHVRLDRERKDYLHSRGVTETLTFVGVKNFASIRNNMRTNQRYKLIYHLAVKGPKGMATNFYPKWNREPWTPCGPELPR